MMVEAAGDRGLAGQPHRLGAGDSERNQVIGPDVLVGEDPVVRLDQAVDQGLGCVMLMQVEQGGRVDHIVL